MSYNGSGTFVINTAGQPVVSGTVISSTAFNALTADLATGLSTAITKDGQTTPTANIPMGNNKITNLAVGTAATDAANLSQVQSTTAKLVNSISGADTITGTMSPNLAAYATGQMFYFIAAGDNTGAVTLNIDSLGAKSVTRDGSVALAAGDIKSGEVVVVVYDGTRFQVVSQINSSGNATFANVSITSALNVGGVATVTGGATLNGGVVINEPGADADTRIEGDTDANLFFADASTDRIGIGTSSPTYKFHVAGTGGYVARFDRTATTSGLDIGADSSGAILQPFGVDAIQFYNAAGTTRNMLLNASGNLGLGVTPSAWASYNAIQVKYASFWGDSSPFASMGANYFFDGSAYKYIANGVSTDYYQSSGSHVWRTAASGTAGNAISFTQAMTLDASGNLSAGTTSVASSGQTNGITAGTVLAVKGALAASTTNAGILEYSSNIMALRAFGATAGTGVIAFRTGGGGDSGDTERGRFTAGGYFKASNDGVYHSATGTQHELRQTADSDIAIFKATNASYTANGLVIGADRNTTNNSFYAFNYYNYGANAFKLRIADSGNVTNTNGSYGTISDAKMKTDIVDAGSQWADLKAVRFRKFKMKDDPSGLMQLGVVAQELEQTSPGLVDEHADRDAEGNDLGTTTKSVKTSVLLMKAAVALQEAMARIESLEAKVAALEAK